MKLDIQRIKPIVKYALEEDIKKGDITTSSIISSGAVINAVLVAKEAGVIAGLPVVREVMGQVGRLYKTPDVVFKMLIKDGNKVRKGQVIACLSGRARVIFAAERTALNFLQRLSGIATLTRRYVDVVGSLKGKDKPEIFDTRKTTPGLRYLEKYAVRCGGGHNHRMDLSEMVMVKDNHLRVQKNLSVPELLNTLKQRVRRGIKIEIEVDTMRQLRSVLNTHVDIIMLDNMSIAQLKKAISVIYKMHSRPLIEVSGGVKLDNLSRIASCGVDRISSGELTHSPRALDISLEIN